MPTPMPGRIALGLALSLTAAGPRADQVGYRGGHEHDHDRARAALERGAVRPIDEVLAAVAREMPGDVVEVELEDEHGHLLYEVKVIAPDGHLREVWVDAATARVRHGGRH